MIKEITVPDIEENVESGVIGTVLVSVGDTIDAETSIVEMETDKAAVEVPAEIAGTVKEIFVAEGDEVSWARSS